MKALKVNLTLIAFFLFLPLCSHANLVLRNNSSTIAQFIVAQGDRNIAYISGIWPGSQMVIPTTNVYEVQASTIIEGNTYTSAPLFVSGSRGFIAQVIQQPDQTFDFDVVDVPSSRPGVLCFSKTSLEPVTYFVRKDVKAVGAVVITDNSEVKDLEIDETFQVYAISVGVTTETITVGPDAVVTSKPQPACGMSKINVIMKSINFTKLCTLTIVS